MEKKGKDRREMEERGKDKTGQRRKENKRKRQIRRGTVKGKDREVRGWKGQ